MSHHSHMLSQAYSVFQIKAACDPPAVEMGRELLDYPLRFQPNQVTRLKAKGRQPSLPVLAHCEPTLQGMQLPAAPWSRKKSSSGQEPACLEGAFLCVCFLLLLWLLHPSIPFQRHNGVIVFPAEDFPFEKQTSRSFPNLTHIQLWKEAAGGAQGRASGKGSRASGTQGGWGQAGQCAGL